MVNKKERLMISIVDVASFIRSRLLKQRRQKQKQEQQKQQQQQQQHQQIKL